MKVRQILEKTNHTLHTWEVALDDYSISDLTKQPAEDAWSIGQVYNHLIHGTLNYHLHQIELCLKNHENTRGKKSFPALLSFHILGSLPPIKVRVPPSKAYTPHQPGSKEEIQKGLQTVKEALQSAAQSLESTTPSGKTKHPALGFLNAHEWFRLIEMHFRHHLRQKKRLDHFLASSDQSIHSA